ncbi:MAG: hypothetical protein IJ903_04885 [Ruminococcus sp.]|nr:hypothetical protein [Ruminococcus sp.]
MEQHIKGMYTITDGDLMLELNALKDKFCIAFQLIDKKREPLERFCEILDNEKIPYTVSDQYKRYMPGIEFPKV